MSETAIREYLPESGSGEVDFYVRGTAPTAGHSTQQSCFERLSKLEASDQLQRVTVRVWGDSICTSAPALEGLDDILETITDIYAFSAEREATVTPFFSVQRIDASLPNEYHERILPPHQTMVLSSGEELVGVFPCRIEETTYTPIDAIEQLEKEADLETLERQEIRVTTHR